MLPPRHADAPRPVQQHWLGAQGMPRRVVDYDERFADVNLFVSIASLGMVIGTAIFFYNMVYSWKKGAPAPAA